MNIKILISFLLFSSLNFFSQTMVRLINYPINLTPNPSIRAYDYYTGDSKSYWNTEENQSIIIDTGDNFLTNIIIYHRDNLSKSFFIRKGDVVSYNYKTKEITSLKYKYLPNDFKLVAISKEDNTNTLPNDGNTSEDFFPIIEIQRGLDKMNFIDIPKNTPKGLPLYRIKLYEYLHSKYALETKKSEKNNLYSDYLKFFNQIYQDPLVTKKEVSSYIFTELNAMSSATTKKDFEDAFSLFKQNTNDVNAIEYIENEFFIQDKLDIQNSFGIIDAYRKQVKFNHLIKQNIGKYILIDFWASWCTPCLHSIPESLELKNKYPKELAVIYLSLDRNFNPWKTAEKRFNIPSEDSFLIVNGMQKDLTIEGIKISSIPRYFIYDKKGKLIKTLEDINEATKFISKIL